MIWVLLLVLVAIGGGVMAGAFGSKKKQLAGATAAPKALEAGASERSIADTRVDDIVTIDNTDYLCEGTVGYDEDGHRWLGARVVDNQTVKWLVVGLERSGGRVTRLCAQDTETHVTGYPPEAIVVGDVRFTLDKRGTATCELRGDVGGLGNADQARRDLRVERCRWWLYSAPGDDTLVVEQWGSDYRVLRGKKVSDETLQLMQAS